MGYKVLYDNQLLFDPYTDDRITDTKLSSKLNAASYFDFTIAPTHSLYSKLEERAGEVRIYFNNLILFKGEITKIDEDFEGNYSVSCTGVLDYLTATRVRPYSTVEGEQPLKAPSSFDGYFQWLIDQHNSNCLDSRKHFSVGVNQGNMLDKNNYIYRSSEQRPTTASEIEDKILNSNGGYLFVRYQDDLNILDLYADVHDVNTQIIDYGVNMLDFTKTTTTEGQYTAVVATGYTPNPPEGQTDTKMKPITLEGCTDGGTPYSSTIVKMGDRVYDVEAVKRYGYHEYYVSNTDITTYDGLLYYACKTLNTLLSPALTISVKAVDLALIMGEKYKHLLLGQAVRIRSKPRKVDEYLMVNSIDLDLMNPDNTTFDLGASYDTLTGQQSAYLKSLNASINASLDTVSALGDNVKNSAKLAQEAKDTANSATEAANNASSKADTANSNATKANATANSANKTANAANDTANKANAKADTANKTANAASSKADTANDTANKADTKADQAITSAGVANNTANSASSKADDAVKKAEQTQENIKVVQKNVDAANEAASNAQTSADAASTAASAAQATANTAKANASKAQTAADAAQSSANAANSAASKAQKSADAANSAIADTNKEVGTINSTITQIKKDAADTRDELSGQIETVKNTMTTDYAKKTELSETEGTLRSEIETSAAGIKSEVSQNYTTKTELSKTNEKVSKAQDTANKAAAAAASNASDLTEAIKTIGKTTDDLQSQIDGSIQTWFADGEPINLNYPAIDWTTDTIKKNHLGDLYYDNTTGYGYRWQIDQNGSYSWKRIVDTDVTKALQDAAKAQGTANSKRRIFVTTPVPPYDVADLWVQGTTGDIMRCQTAKGEGQTYAAADWIKASKYTDDTAVTKLAETVSVTYATKTTVNQLSDRIEQTVESVETVSASASAAQAAADKANDAAKAAQSTADTAKANAVTAQTSADTAKNAANAAQKAADNAKSAADTAQSAADTANADLATAKKNLEAVQNQADATDEQVAAAKAAVVKAQGAADKANTAAANAKSAADTAQSTANTAKANAATAQSKANAAATAASTAQSTADTAKANAKKAQDDVDAVKNRVTAAETSIKQNSDSIALRATKTEVTNAINGISVGGRNYVLDSGGVSYLSRKIDNTHQKLGNNTVKLSVTSSNSSLKYDAALYKLTVTDLSEYLGKNLVISAWIYRDSKLQYYGYEFRVIYTHNGSTVYSGPNKNYPYNIPTSLEVGWNRVYGVFSIPEDSIRVDFNITTFAANASSTIWISSPKLEIGNKPTDWSPAPEDVEKDATTKADAALTSAKTYTDAQLKITSEGITSTVSKTYATKTDLSTTNSNVTRAQETADSATTVAANAQKTANDVKTDLATNYTTTTDMESKISQSAEGITSTVSKTYATKTELSTTNSKVSKAQSDATAAGTAASNAQSTANTGVANAKAAQNTANTAVANAKTAQSTADTAKANAKTAQDTADGVKADLKANYTTTTDMESKISQSAEGITSTVSKTYATKSELSTTNSNVSKAQSTADSGVSKANAAQSTANTAKSTADSAVTKANAAQSTANLKGIDYSQGKMLHTDPTFLTGLNDVRAYLFTSNHEVRLTRTGKSTDNPIKSATNEVQIKVVGPTSPGLGGFMFGDVAYANRIIIFRMIAKIPTGYTVNFATNSLGNNAKTRWLTDVAGTGKFTEYVHKVECGQSGNFSNTDYFYIDGPAATAANPVIWYVAYATTFDMTDVGDALTANRNIETLKTNVETNYATKSLLTQTAEGITSEVSKTYSTKTELSTTNSKIDNLSVGGRNLAVGTKTISGVNVFGSPKVENTLYGCTAVHTTTAWVGIGFMGKPLGESGKFKVGDELTVSVYFKINAKLDNPGKIYLYRVTNKSHAFGLECDAGGVSSNKDFVDITSLPLNTWIRVWASFVANDYSLSDHIMRFESSVGNDIYWAAPQLEKGNKPTDWSPAPEDVDASITTVDNKFKSYSTTEQTKSLINQSAESIKSEVSKTYQVKGDYATNSSVRSAIEQSANSITSTVESTYATKATVEALKNIADNAIESWSGTGVPTLTNKPASDWTTDTLKKQHLGDLYYDKATSYGYRFNQNGSGYSWDLIRDTGITQALADAAAANDAAKKAQSTANSGLSKANAAQSTANSASTAASNAQTTANTAKANAATAQADVDKLKTDIPNTYATKSSLTQTAEAITAKVETAQSTADGAVTAASKAQQTANSISTTLSKNYTTTADADKKYATQSSLTQTAKSLTSKISSVETATAKAQADATSAIGKADQAHSDVGSLKTRMSTAETKITQNTDAIALRATKTEVTNGLATKPDLGQTVLTYPLVAAANLSKYWVRLGTLVSNGDNSTVSMHVLTGNGYNGSASQNSEFWIYIKDGYASGSSTKWFGGTVNLGLNCTDVDVKLFASDQLTCDIWVKLPWSYPMGDYTIQGRYKSWTPNKNKDNQAETPAPSGQIEQDVAIRTIAPTSYVDAQIKVSADRITSTVSSVRTIAETAKSTADTAKANAATATTTANTAKSTADTAKKAADSASSTANEAATNAATAKSDASTAKITANTAKSTADAASKTANTAKSTADTAQSTADTAQSTANDVKDDLAENYSTTTEMNSSINQTAESIKTTVSKEYTKITDADNKYATKTSLTQTANDLTIDFDNKIGNINKYVRFVDGNVILGEAGNPITLKLTNDHLDILNNANVVAKFAENTIELGNDSYLSEIKLCKGLGSIQGYTQSGEDSDPLISIGASSGVRLYATREVNAGHLTTGGFNVLTSTDSSNNTATMFSSSFLRGNNGTIQKEAAVSVTTSNTGDSACDITASKIRINSRDVFTLTKLWSGSLSKGGSVNVSQGNQYTLFAVCPGGDGVLMIGVKYKNELHCYASVDSGELTTQYRASFRISGNTFRLVAASCNMLNGANSGKTVTEIYGIL